MCKLECEMFVCRLRGTCMYEGECNKCKITPCQICVLYKYCKKGKENVHATQRDRN